MQTFTLAWQMEGHKHSYTITAGHRCLIGRQDTSCDIVLNLPTVSRQHAAIDMVGETFYLYNLSQTNLVYLNGQTRLRCNQNMPLQPGDTFRLGSITFELQEARKAVANVYKLRCAHCERVVDYHPEAFCPWCGRALSNGETVILNTNAA
jgi:predicted component of type VI protein secretion system